MKKTIMIRDTGVTVTEVLRLIAKGYSYEQIFRIHPGLNTADISAVAQLTLDIMEKYVTPENCLEIDREIRLTAHDGRLVDVSKIRREYPRAYESWKAAEETQLVELYKHGATITRIAEILKRQPGAVRYRLQKLKMLPVVQSTKDSS